MFISEEIATQLICSSPKMIIGLADRDDVLRKACEIAKKPEIKVVSVKNDLNTAIKPGMINFFEMINPKGKYF